MRTKLLALALAAMIAIGTGGVLAADDASTDGEPSADRTDDPATPVEDDHPSASRDGTYDRKLTAGEAIALEPNVLRFENDGIIGLSFQEPTQRTVSIGSEASNGTVTIETRESTTTTGPPSGTDAERDATVYDEKLTAEERAELELTVIHPVRAGLTEFSTQAPTEYNWTGTGSMTVESGSGGTEPARNATRVTANEAVSLHPSVIQFDGNGVVRFDFQDPIRLSLSIGSETGNETVSVETSGDT